MPTKDEPPLDDQTVTTRRSVYDKDEELWFILRRVGKGLPTAGGRWFANEVYGEGDTEGEAWRTATQDFELRRYPREARDADAG